MKTRYSVNHAGQKFTRMSNAGRIYTHLILCKSNRDDDVARAKADAASDARVNYPHYVREAGPNPQFPTIIRSAEEKARFKHIASLTAQEYYVVQHDLAMGHINARDARGDYKRFWEFSWAGRPELAAKQVEKARKQGYLEVIAVPVTPIAVKSRK